MSRIGTGARIAGLAAIAAASAALAAHDEPRQAKRFTVDFVRAFARCVSPTSSHNPPVPFAACPPVAASPAVGFGPHGFGELKGHVVLDAMKHGVDVEMVVRFLDVRNGDDGTGSRFDGWLTLVVVGRSTDHGCGGTKHDPCTMIDAPLPIGVPCGSVATPPLAPGRCHLKTSWNTQVPGLVQPGNHASIGLGQPLVYAPGAQLAFEGGVELP